LYTSAFLESQSSSNINYNKYKLSSNINYNKYKLSSTINYNKL